MKICNQSKKLSKLLSGFFFKSMQCFNLDFDCDLVVILFDTIIRRQLNSYNCAFVEHLWYIFL